MTKEHLWPDWVRSEIVASRGYKSFDAELERRGETTRYKNPNLEQRVRMPCNRCNHGWMSDLEGEIAGFARPMVARGDLVLLTPSRQMALTRWALKIAMVYEFVSPPEEGKYFTQPERQAFKERFEFPENLWIWTGRYDGPRPLHAVQRRAPRGAITLGLYSFTFSANFLVLQVFAYRTRVGDFAADAHATRTDRLSQLWPPRDWQSWPPPMTIDDDALMVLDDRFADRLTKR